MSNALRGIEDLATIKEYFRDVTEDYMHCKKVQQELKIVDIIGMYNKHCACDVRCPFGCTDFLYNCGTIPFHLVLRKFVNSKHIPIFNHQYEKVNNVVETLNRYIKSPRRDYLTYKDRILEEFEIRPAIMVKKNEGLVVLTCGIHDKGYGKYIIHPPYRPVNKHMPTPKPDQLAHAVVVPRNLKPFKASNYSNTYQMTEMRGNYTGLDTCNIVEFGNFWHKSEMMMDSESLSIANREDIKAKSRQYVEMRVIPQSVWRETMNYLPFFY